MPRPAIGEWGDGEVGRWGDRRWERPAPNPHHPISPTPHLQLRWGLPPRIGLGGDPTAVPVSRQRPGCRLKTDVSTETPRAAKSSTMRGTRPVAWNVPSTAPPAAVRSTTNENTSLMATVDP